MNSSEMQSTSHAGALSPDALVVLRGTLAHQLFEIDPPDPVALLAHGPWDDTPPRPSVEQLLFPLSKGMREFRISW